MAVVVFVFVGQHYMGVQYTAAHRKDVVGCFGSEQRFADYFSGGISFKDWMSGERFLGVWGARNCARFRRLLGEWGSGVDVAHCAPPASSQFAETRAQRLSRTARAMLEASIKQDWPVG